MTALSQVSCGCWWCGGGWWPQTAELLFWSMLWSSREGAAHATATQRAPSSYCRSMQPMRHSLSGHTATSQLMKAAGAALTQHHVHADFTAVHLVGQPHNLGNVAAAGRQGVGGAVRGVPPGTCEAHQQAAEPNVLACAGPSAAQMQATEATCCSSWRKLLRGDKLARGSSLEGSIHIAKLRTHRALSGK